MPEDIVTGFRKMGFYKLARRNEYERLDHLPGGFASLSRREFEVPKGADTDRFWWVRDRLEDGEIPSYINTLFRVDATSYEDSVVTDGIEEWLESGYVEMPNQGALAPDEVVARAIAELEGEGPPDAESIRYFARILALCPRERLSELIRTHFGRYFFNAFPDGELRAYSVDFRLVSRMRGIRAAHAAKAHPEQDVDEEIGFGALEDWQPTDAQSHFELILLLGSLLFYPRLPYLVTGRFGITFVLDFGEWQVIDPHNEDVSWLDLMRPKAELGGEDRAAHRVIADEKSPDRLFSPAVQKRYVQYAAPNWEGAHHVLDWLATQAEQLLRDSLALPPFSDDEGFIKFGDCWQHHFTLDRLFRRGILCTAGSSITTRLDSFFDSVDVMGGVREYWGKPIADDRFFRDIFTPGESTRAIRHAFSDAPRVIQTLIENQLDALHEELSKKLRDSIPFESIVKEDGESVKFRDPYSDHGEFVEQSWEEFVGRMMRALRNTHHGYLMANPNSRRYLGLTTGNIPDSITHFGVLLALAAAVDPEGLLGFEPPNYESHVPLKNEFRLV